MRLVAGLLVLVAACKASTTSRPDAEPADAGVDACTPLPTQTWRRLVEWKPGTVAGTTTGNPAPDLDGRLVWFYEQTTGGPIGATDAWYTRPAQRLLWDDDWFGSPGVWAVSDNIGPLVNDRELTHLARSDLWPIVPRVRWLNLLGRPVTLEISGVFKVTWAGEMAAPPADVDVAIAKLDASGAAAGDVLVTTVAKPTPGTTSESGLVPVSPSRFATLAPDESLVISLRLRAPVDDSRWIYLEDNLTLTGRGCN